MNRFEVANASFKVDGYFFSGAKEINGEYRKPEALESFDAAKKELISHIKREIKNIELLTLEQFLHSKKKDFK